MATVGEAATLARGGAETGSKPKRHWLAVLFGLPFAGGGIAVLVFLVLPATTGTWRAQSWEQGEAMLVSASLETRRGDDATTYRVNARYTYQYRGRDYSSDRVTISDAADNIGSFQQDLARRLIRAREAGRPVPVWINPANPREAVLNRDFRWGVLALSLGLGVVFTGVGGSLAWFGLRARRKTAAAPFAVDRPWLLRPEWAGPAIRSGGGAKIAWVMTVLWNAIAVPIGILGTLEFLGGNRPAAFALLFPLVGAGLLTWALRETLAWRRFGAAPLVMDPYPGAIGGQVGGTVDVRLPYDSQLTFRTSLTCVYSYMSGSGKNRRRSERVAWQTGGAAHTVPRLGHTRLEILFDVDDGLPPSDPQEGSAYHLWRLHVEADLPGVDFQRVFEIPVFPTGAASRELRRLSTEHPAAAAERARLIKSVLDVRHVPGGIELYYPAFRNPLARVLGLVFGSVFLAVGVLAGGAPLGMRVIFALVGGGIAAASLYNLLLALRVRIDHVGVRTERRLLGVPAGGATLPRHEIACLTLKQSYSAHSGGKHTVFFKLQAQLDGGRAVKIGHNLAGRETAKQVLDELCGLTGLPLDPGLEGNVLG